MRTKTEGDKTWCLLTDVAEMENRYHKEKTTLRAQIKEASEIMTGLLMTGREMADDYERSSGFRWNDFEDKARDWKSKTKGIQ